MTRLDAGPAGPPATFLAALGGWWRQGARTAFFLPPRWAGLRPTPLGVPCLLAASWAIDLLAQWLIIVGPARFEWPALLADGLLPLGTLWACWLLVPRPRDPDPDPGAEPGPVPAPVPTAPSAVALFALVVALQGVIGLVLGLVYVPLAHGVWTIPAMLGQAGRQAAAIVPHAWLAGATAVLLWRAGALRRAPRAFVALAAAAATALYAWVQPFSHWYPDPAEGERPAYLVLTQALTEAQPALLAERLQALQPQRPGVVDVYAITFAPYGSEDVFRRESQLVADVMQERFGSSGRTLQLVNHPGTAQTWPWATPLNLQRAIRRAAELMDPGEDVLFIHLTSHGARGGPLAAALWPLHIDPVTPAMLRAWLDEAGVRWRIVSVSACYSGSWIAPLAGEETLVMTAADAEHTSFGCGRFSELTFFGRAVYDEQLRHTWSFEQAHAAARPVIERREQEAGKADGFSNPQIQLGDRLRDRLAQLEAQRRAASSQP